MDNPLPQSLDFHPGPTQPVQGDDDAHDGRNDSNPSRLAFPEPPRVKIVTHALGLSPCRCWRLRAGGPSTRRGSCPRAQLVSMRWAI